MFDHLTRRILDPDGALGSTPTTTDDFLWDGDELVGSLRTNSSVILLFAYGPSPDMVLFEDDVWSALHTTLGDHLNTVRDVLSTTGTVENHIVYTTYGEVKSETSGGYSPFMKYTGKPLDAVTGLQYNMHRWYDAAVGRWISEDPIGFGGGGTNLSEYTSNSPTNRIDPFGLEAVGKAVKTHQARRWWNDDWYDWLNPFAWSASIGDAIGDGVSSVVYIDTDFKNNREMGTSVLNDINNNGGHHVDDFGRTQQMGGPSSTTVKNAAAGSIIFTATAAGGITFGHGGRHLTGTGLSEASVENAIRSQLQSAGSYGNHWGWVQVNGQWIEYRVFVQAGGGTNVGTYFPVSGPLAPR